jgi:hypothetical protein
MGGINMKRILIAIAILGLTACTTFEPPFQSASVHYNRVIADTNNELILLNVIRAKEREPMYFTAVSQMRGSLTLSGTTGLSADFPEDGFTSVKSFEDSESIASRTIGKLTETAANSSRTIKPSVSATIATNPSFDYQVLDTQKFYNGIMASIPPSLLASYLRQGWRDTLLMALTVEKVEFYKVSDEGDTAPDTLIATVQNDPIGMPKQDFGYFLRCFKTAPISPPPAKRTVFNLSQIKNPSLHGLFDLKKNGYSIDENGDIAYSVNRADSLEVTLRTDRPRKDCDSFLTNLSEEKNTGFDLAKTLNDNETISATAQDKRWESQRNSDTDQSTSVRNGIAITYTLRSTQSVLYFLGEYLREKEHNGAAYTLGGDDNSKGEEVFEVLKDKPTSVFSQTELNGTPYWIESAKSGSKNNTLSSMAFINQMINLQKSADERPTTETVRSVR